MSEVRSAMETIKNYADSDALIVFGTVYDDSMGDKVRVTVIATGLDQNGTDDSIVKTSFVNGKPAVDNPSNLWRLPAPLRILCRMICSATSTHLPNLRFTLLLLRVQLLLLLSRRRIALQHRPTQQLRLQSLKSRLKKLRRKSILSELIHRSLRKRLSRLLLRRLNQKNFSPKPSIRSTRLSVARSQRLMPAVSKARKTTRFSATSTPATTSVLPATCSATLNPQAGNGNDSGLWTANQHNGAPEAKGQGAAEAKAEDEKPRFEYGIPAFLRKKN